MDDGGVGPDWPTDDKTQLEVRVDSGGGGVLASSVTWSTLALLVVAIWQVALRRCASVACSPFMRQN